MVNYIPMSPVEVEKTTKPTTEQEIVRLDDACEQLIQLRQNPLLVLFYPPLARMSEDELDEVYLAFRKEGVEPMQGLSSLDVLVDSYGGDPVAAYRLAQLIRNLAKEVYFLVPSHAYSAATLLCFCGNEIRLGHYAGLSPIDITVISEPGKKPRQEVELATVDTFVEFAGTARRKIEIVLEKMGREATTNVDSELLVEMVKQVGALQVGKFFRERTLTGHYAEELLDNYMFPQALDRASRRDQVISNFLFGAPAHSFHLDYHLCFKWGLAVVEMSKEEHDRSEAAVRVLEELSETKTICPSLSKYDRLPFIRYYPKKTSTKSEICDEHE